MHSRFGVKEFLALLLLAAIALGVWLGLAQRDREWQRLVAIDRRLGDLEAQLGGLEVQVGRIADGLRGAVATGAVPDAALRSVGSAPAAAVQSSSPPAPGTGTGSSSGAGAWARPDIPIVSFGPHAPHSDPRAQPGFRADGTFTECFDAEPARLTPHLASDVYSRRVFTHVVEPLAAYDPESLELRGVLAEAWQVDPAFRWLRVRLRDGATFSDGTPVTAEDVRFTFADYILNPELDARRVRSTVDMVEAVQVIDPRTVEFAFSTPVFTNVDNTLTVEILPSHVYSRLEPATINQATGLVVGSGPFKFASPELAEQWAPGREIVLVRNERYWGPKPALRELRFRVVGNDVARLGAFERGDADMVEPSASQLLAALNDRAWLERNQALSWVNMRSRFAFLGWNCGERKGRLTPFADARVRQAMTLAIDREQIVRDVYEGIGRVSTGPAPEGSLAIDPSIAAWPYDLERARALLGEAGWRDRDGSGTLRNERGEPFEFEILIPQESKSGSRIAEYVSEQCRELGIACTVRAPEWAIVQELTATRDYDVALMGWQFNSPETDPRQAYHSSSIANRGDNFMQWRHPDADALIESGRGELDPAKRQRIWWTLHRLLHDEQPQTFLVDVPWRRLIRGEIGNVHPYPSGLEVGEFFRGAGPLPVPPG